MPRRDTGWNLSRSPDDTSISALPSPVGITIVPQRELLGGTRCRVRLLSAPTARTAELVDQLHSIVTELVDPLERTRPASLFGVSGRPGLDAGVAPGESRRGWVGFAMLPTPPASDFAKGDLAAQVTTFSLP